MNKMRLLLLAAVGAFLVESYASGESYKRAEADLTVDAYCQNTYGNASYLCRQQYSTGYDYVCDSLYCFDSRYTGTCVFSVPPKDSTLCGNGKWCEQNSCQTSSHAPATTDACPLGDSSNPNVVLDMSCADIASTRTSMCLRDDVNKTWCCDTCAKVPAVDPATFTGTAISADADCKALLGPKSYFCQTDPNYGGVYTSVCSHLRCMNPVSGNCEDYPASNGVPCAAGKWCIDANCVASSAAPVDPKGECYFGNEFEQFCISNVKYPNVAVYCERYGTGCCDACSKYRNESKPAGCQYGDKHPDQCQTHVKDGTIISFCHTNEADCCETCADLKKHGDADCPYGDISNSKCDALMKDSIGPGNCYSPSHRKECCETCPKYYNASQTGCEYGDHWKDYCATNVVVPNVATTCDRYENQCCGTCGKFKETGHPGCKYGDTDPTSCDALMKDPLGTSNCYNLIHRTQCCGTCDRVKDTSVQGCLYGDNKPVECNKLMNDTRGSGNCYDFRTQIDCCRTCNELRNTSNTGCEYGDRVQDYCTTNILDQDSAWLCFQHEADCCRSCQQYKISEHVDCKYGDKNPINCKFMIPDEAIARARCPSLGIQCCLTCSKYGHPGPAGAISQEHLSRLAAVTVG